MNLQLAIPFCLLLAALVAETEGKKTKHRHNKKGGDDAESEEEEEDHFECFKCEGAECSETEEECFACYTLTSNMTSTKVVSDTVTMEPSEDGSTVMKGCIQDEDEAEDLEEDKCVEGEKDGVTGQICYCKEELCNSADSLHPLLLLPLLLFLAWISL